MKRSQKKKGRKSVWSEESINKVIDVICESDYYRKKLIFINNKATKNSEIYEKVTKDVQDPFASRNSKCLFTVGQVRIKFKACVAACKKAAMMRKTASGIDNFINQKGYGSWFKKLYPFIESRDSCDPDKGTEPSFEISDINIELDGSNVCSSDSSTAAATKTNKELYVPTKKGTKKENANYLLKEAVATFNSFVAQDPTKILIAYFREENALNRKHEMELAQMQMQMWQTILMATMGQQQNIHQPQKRPASTQASTQPNIHSLQNSFCFGGVQTPFEVERNNNDSEYKSWVSYLGQNDNN